MDTACYYTFSTISQTLAGAFGFLVAVVIYRMQRIDGELVVKLNDAVARRGLSDRLDYLKARDAHDWPTIGMLLRETGVSETGFLPTPLPPETAKQLNAGRDEFLAILDSLQSIKDRLRKSLEATGLTIFGSLALLALTPLIARSSFLTGILLLADIGAAAYCLCMYYGLAVGVTK
jgi:hypothetical protein